MSIDNSNTKWAVFLRKKVKRILQSLQVNYVDNCCDEVFTCNVSFREDIVAETATNEITLANINVNSSTLLVFRNGLLKSIGVDYTLDLTGPNIIITFSEAFGNTPGGEGDETVILLYQYSTCTI